MQHHFSESSAHAAHPTLHGKRRAYRAAHRRGAAAPGGPRQGCARPAGPWRAAGGAGIGAGPDHKARRDKGHSGRQRGPWQSKGDGCMPDLLDKVKVVFTRDGHRCVTLGRYRYIRYGAGGVWVLVWGPSFGWCAPSPRERVPACVHVALMRALLYRFPHDG